MNEKYVLQVMIILCTGIFINLRLLLQILLLFIIHLKKEGHRKKCKRTLCIPKFLLFIYFNISMESREDK